MNDVDEVCVCVVDVFKLYWFMLIGELCVLYSCMYYVCWGNLLLNLFDYGGGVSIELGLFEYFFLL